jgi:hypothetical protein
LFVDPGPAALLRFAPELLAITLARQRLLGSPLVPRFQVEGVLFDVLDDVFLLHLPLEPPESALDGFALLNLDFSHAVKHPLTGLVAPCEGPYKMKRMMKMNKMRDLMTSMDLMYYQYQ